MRLSLAAPAGWSLTREAHQTVARSPGGQVLVAWGPLVAAAGDLATRLLAVALEGRRLELGRVTPRRTDRGWAYTESDGRIWDGDALVEERVAAVYAFDDWRGTALVRALAPSPALSAARAALGGGFPDWRADGHIVCFEHLYAEAG